MIFMYSNQTFWMSRIFDGSHHAGRFFSRAQRPRNFAPSCGKNRIAESKLTMMLSTRSFKLLILSMLATAYVGCEAQGESFKHVQLTSNHAVIYVYRPFDLTSSALDPEITCGHATIAISSGGYYTFVEEPGTITCSASSDPTSRIQFETRPETEYFVAEVVAPGVREGRVSLKQMSRATGLDEIELCRYTVQ